MYNWAEFLQKGNRNIFTQSLSARRLVEIIIGSVPKGSNILEVGCGTALSSLILADCGFDVTASDTDPKVLEDASKRISSLNQPVKLVKADILSLSSYFKEKSFDLVFSKGVMEHFNDEEAIRGLKEQGKIARKVIFHIPNSNSKANGNHFGDERFLSNKKWVSLIKEAGFKKVVVLGDYDLQRWLYVLPAFLFRAEFSFWWKHFSRHTIFVCE